MKQSRKHKWILFGCSLLLSVLIMLCIIPTINMDETQLPLAQILFFGPGFLLTRLFHIPNLNLIFVLGYSVVTWTAIFFASFLLVSRLSRNKQECASTGKLQGS